MRLSPTASLLSLSDPLPQPPLSDSSPTASSLAHPPPRPRSGATAAGRWAVVGSGGVVARATGGSRIWWRGGSGDGRRIQWRDHSGDGKVRGGGSRSFSPAPPSSPSPAATTPSPSLRSDTRGAVEAATRLDSGGCDDDGQALVRPPPPPLSQIRRLWGGGAWLVHPAVELRHRSD